MDHNPAAEFYLLDCGIEPRTLADLRAFAISRGIQLTFVNLDVTLFRDLPTNKALSVATYARYNPDSRYSIKSFCSSFPNKAAP